MTGVFLKNGIQEVRLSKDEPFSSLAFDRTVHVLTIVQYQWVNNLPTKQASPTIELQLTGIIADILKGFT